TRLRLVSTTTLCVRPWLKLCFTCPERPPAPPPRPRGFFPSLSLIRSRILPGRGTADLPAQTVQSAGVPDDPVGQTSGCERAVYDMIARECQTQFRCRQAPEPAAARRRPQLALATVRPVAGLEKHLCLAVGQPALDLFESRDRIAGLARQPDQFDHPPRQRRLDSVHEIRFRPYMGLCTPGKQPLVGGSLQGRPVGRDPEAAAGQFFG